MRSCGFRRAVYTAKFAGLPEYGCTFTFRNGEAEEEEEEAKREKGSGEKVESASYR